MDDKLTSLGTYSPEELSSSPSTIDADPLSPSSLTALNRLARYKPPLDTIEGLGRAAVLVALFPSRNGGELNVLLSTRAQAMRTHPGDVALPGGKVEVGDINLEATARREAFEEVGIPLNVDSIRYLSSLPPTVSPNGLLVTPIVVLVLDNTLKLELNESEVADVFSHPLSTFLSSTLPPHLLPSWPPDTPYHSAHNYSWKGRPPHRFHTFATKTPGKQITGWTAGVLVSVAKVAYGRQTDYELVCEGQMSRRELIEFTIRQKDEKEKSRL